MDLALNNLQKSIYHKTQPTKPNQTYFHYLKGRLKVLSLIIFIILISSSLILLFVSLRLYAINSFTNN